MSLSLSHSRKGFTLVETVFTLSIVLVVVLASTFFIANSVKQSQIVTEKTSSSQFFIIVNSMVRHNFAFVNSKNIDPIDTLEASSTVVPAIPDGYSKTTLATSLATQKPLLKIPVDGQIINSIATARPDMASVLTGTNLPIYVNSSVLGQTSFREGVEEIRKSHSQVLISRCLTKAELQTIGNQPNDRVFAELLYTKRWRPVVFSKNQSKTVRCCQNSGSSIVCDEQNSSLYRPVVIKALIDDSLKLTGLTYFPKENDSSAGTGFFFHFDRTNAGRVLARINSFSLYDYCKGSTAHCEEKLGENFHDYKLKAFSWVTPIVSALESASIFSLE